MGSVSSQGKDDLGRDLMLHRRCLDGSDRDKEVVVPYGTSLDDSHGMPSGLVTLSISSKS